MKIEDRLFLNRYRADEEHPHLKIKDMDVCKNCKDKPCINCCPAGVYQWDGEFMEVKFEGCLECGTCRIVCPYNNIEWEYPNGNYGILYKFG
ncbi:ferredoxin family protein [Marinitoga litoralis]|uniref:ferredoxin family protein n=1 Tax=Marinitoga litoralis TaxID=570855 RepID=UPI003B849061